MDYTRQRGFKIVDPAKRSNLSSVDAPWIAEIHSPVHHTGIAYNCSIFNYFLENVPAEEELLEDWLSANGSLEKFLMTLPLAVQVE